MQERNVKSSQGIGQESSRLTATARRKLGTLGTDINSLAELLEAPACSHLYALYLQRHLVLMHNSITLVCQFIMQ